MKLKFSFIMVLVCSLSCSLLPNTKRTPSSTADQIEVLDMDLLQSLPAIGDRKILKFSLLKDASGQFSKLYIQSSKFQFHYEFLSTLPEFKDMNQKEIEALTYKNTPNRKAYIGVYSVEYSWFADMDRPSGSGFYVMADELPPTEIISAISEKLAAFGELESGDPSNFIALPHQEAEAAAKSTSFKEAGLRLTIERQSTKRAYSDGWNIGVLKIAQNKEELEAAIQKNEVTKETVLVVGEALRELPPCAAVISSVPLTAGSHLSLLAQMYAIPIVYEKDALKKYSSYANKTVLVASNVENGGNFQFFANMTVDEIQVLKSAKKIAELKFEFDPTIQDIVPVSTLNSSNVKSYGGKATQFGLLQRVIPQYTLEGAAGIPLYYFSEFTRLAQYEGISLKTYIQKQLGDLKKDSNYSEVSHVSENIRAAFKNATLTTDFFNQIKSKLIKVLNINSAMIPGSVVRLKIRSSSNIEDGSEFNGAGLYESEGVCILNCLKDDFEKGLRKVWGSLYSDRGIWARRTFHIDESKVGMGLLVHSPFKTEIFNGVIRISQKKNDDGSIAQFSEVTTQKGEEESVTNAVGAGSAEVISISEVGKLSVQTSYKGFPKGRTLMNPVHYPELHRLMQTLIKNWTMPGNLLEIESEWKIMIVDEKEKIFIKQVRQVPRQNKINLADGSERIWITGGQIHFKASSEGIFDPLLGLFRVRDLKLQIKSFTEKELMAGKITVSEAVVTYKNQNISLKAGKISSRLIDGVWNLTVPLIHPELPGFKITFALAKTRDDIITVSAEGFTANYSTKVAALNSYSENKIEGESLLPATDYLEYFNPLQQSPTRIEIRSVKTCPVSIQANRELYLGKYDRARMYLNQMEIAGILPNKAIKISNVKDSFHQQYIHDGRNLLAIDLFADTSLTEKDKVQIDKQLGRYLVSSLQFYDPDILTGEGNFGFVKDNFKRAAPLKGCLDAKFF